MKKMIINKEMGGITILELLKKLDICREEVIIKVNGKITPELYTLKEGDELEIIRVVGSE